MTKPYRYFLLFALSIATQNPLFSQSLGFKKAVSIGGRLNEIANGISVDANGNSLVVGYFLDSADFDPSPATAYLKSKGSYDVFLAKYDKNGKYLWAKAIGGTDSEFGNSIAVDVIGNAYITGVFRGTADFDPNAGTSNLTSAGGDDIFIAKYDSSGNLSWAGRIGNSGTDNAKSIAIDANRNVYITGFFAGTVDFDPSGNTANKISGGVNDAFFAKYNTNGTYIWAHDIGGTWDEYGTGICIDGNSNVYLAGTFNGTVDFNPQGTALQLVSAGGEDMFLAKYSSVTGNLIWVNQIGANDPSIGNIRTIDTDLNGNVYISGFIWGSMDFDPGSGSKILSAINNQDAFIAKYDMNGAFKWAGNMGSSSTEEGLVLAFDSYQNVYLSGTFFNTVDFDFTADSLKLSSAGNLDIFLVKYDPNGNCKWAHRFGNANMEKCLAMAIDADDQIRITGFYYGTLQLDPKSVSGSITAVGQADVFMATYCGTAPDLTGGISGSNNVCSGNYLTYSVNANILADNYTWALPPGWFGSSDSNTIKVKAGNNGGTLSVMAGNSCGTSSNQSLSIAVTYTDVSVTVAGDMLSANNSNATYKWLDCKAGKTPVSGAINQSFTPSVSGSYAVIVSKNGCSDTSECVQLYLSGIENQTSAGFGIYPNPSSGSFTLIPGKINGDVLISICDIQGRLVYHETLNVEGDLLIAYPGADGVYVISIQLEDGQILKQRLVIRNQ